jgi:preprotein translocase subunit SecE
MLKLKTFIKDSYWEMKSKVSWPTYKELQESSILVLIASLIFALIIGVMDLVFKGVLKDWFYVVF